MSLNPNLYPDGEMPPDPVEGAARNRGARELAKAGIARPGYDLSAAAPQPAAPAQPLPPHIAAKLAGAGHVGELGGSSTMAAAPPVAAGSPSVSSQPVADENDYSFADDYSDPTGVNLAQTGTSPELEQALAAIGLGQQPAPTGSTMSPELQAAASSLNLDQGITPPMGAITECPECGHKQPKSHKKCAECGFDLAKLQMGVDQTRADLLLADTTKIKCPKCDTLNPASNKKCSNCGHDLTDARSAAFAKKAKEGKLGQESDPDLQLATLSSAERDKLPESDFAIPSERRYPIHDIGHAINALSRCAGKSEESTVKAAVYKRYPSLKKGSTNASQEHAVTLFDSSLKLADKRDTGDGLIWKAICKTGTLALSPGPGQVDVEKPLELTPDLFKELVLSVEEQAFPYVTVPLTHGNGLLENTGYVRKLKSELSQDPQDPPGTEVLWAGIDFTEPDIKEKVLRGSIPDTSVGVKFNYRNKRSGKTYPAALEHVALTHQPWVDGLTPFGLSQPEQGVFDHEEQEPEWDGVFIHASQAGDNPGGGILPNDAEAGGISDQQMPPVRHTRRPARRSGAQTAEELLAAATVRAEEAETRARAAELRLDQLEGTVLSQAEAGHTLNVEAKAKTWGQKPPAIVQRAKEVLLAAGPQPHEVTEDNATLTLSVHVPGEGDEDAGKVETHHLSVEGIVDHIMSAVPDFGPGVTVKHVMEDAQLYASQRRDEKSPEDKAKQLLEDAKNLAAGSGIGTVI